ncbi:unnamed protein product [Clavelina lepadiformis]|uniref:Uncharacterized protein n=1 Tax=Clavelina lepadiformis TaxID=159417 RepID=A0ABP0G211_CLALP
MAGIIKTGKYSTFQRDHKVQDGLVYCAVGYNGTNVLSSCESYNPEERKWSSIRNMNIKRTYHALVSARGLLYALGGIDDDYNRTNTAECYDPRNGKWEYIPQMKTRRYGLTAVVLNNEIYAIGGNDGSNPPSSVEKYDLDTKTWLDVPSMNEERFGGSACVVDGLIWVFGGMQNRSFVVLAMESDSSSSSEEECLAKKAVALTYRQRKLRVWVRNAFKKKDISSCKLIEELAIGDREMCFRCMRMTSSGLEHLLCLVAPQITKQVTNYRKPIPPEQRLSLTLRHLATGGSHIS